MEILYNILFFVMIFIIAFVIYLIKNRKNKLYVSYYPNGRIKEKIMVDENGKFDGMFEQYYPNGNLRVRSFLKKGDKHGRYSEYDENGKITKEERYKNGIKE